MNRNLFFKTFIILVLVLMLFSACGQMTESNKGGVVITDSANNEVQLEKVPERIVSCAPNITEIVYALGKGDKLVGRTDYCDYPAEVSSVESIGSLMEPNIEKIISLKPDLVVVSTHFKKENYNKLKEVGINVAYLYASKSYEGVYDIIEKMGKLLHAQRKSKKVISNMKAKVRKVEKAVKDKSRPKVYYVIGFGKYGDYTATGETFISKMIEMAGGDNIASDAKGWQYSIEKIIEKNPDILICSKYNNMKENLIKANGYKDLPAVKAGRVFEIDNNMIDRQGPRLADGLLELAKIIHPEVF